MLSERVQAEPAEEQNSKREEHFAQPGQCKTPHQAESAQGSSAKTEVVFWPSQHFLRMMFGRYTSSVSLRSVMVAGGF